MINTENVQPSSIIQTEPITFGNTNVRTDTYMYVITIRKIKEVINVKENKEEYMESFGGRKEKRMMLQLYYNLKFKKNKKIMT